MDLGNELQKGLSDEELEREWQRINEQTSDEESPNQSSPGWIQQYRNDFLNVLEDVNDDSEIQETLIHRYVELECHRRLLEIRVQHNSADASNPEGSLDARLSLIEKLSERIAGFVDERFCRYLESFLNDPDGFVRTG